LPSIECRRIEIQRVHPIPFHEFLLHWILCKSLVAESPLDCLKC
jgi:hypothetical protein